MDYHADYHAIHGHDVASFDDLPSTHRLPTVSAAQALEECSGNELTHIPTGLEALDVALGAGLDGLGSGRGIPRGQVTEIWGPPGAGKTAFGIQLAANCLREAKGVVWVDGFHPVSAERLSSVARSESRGHDNKQQVTTAELLDKYTHYSCPSLAHLIALLCRPTTSSVPPGVSLVVVDSLSALVNHAFPKVHESRTTPAAKGSRGPSLAARRLQVLQYIIGGLQKLAATRDVAVVILTQCASKMQAERGATLVPAINATVWEQGVSARLVLFRDWIQHSSKLQSLRFVGIQKVNGKARDTRSDSVYVFDITSTGLVLVECDDPQPSMPVLTTPASKRKLADTKFEIADSEDEEYGWDDDEAEAIPMPSQWQGSEDLLLNQAPDSDDEEEDHASTEDVPLPDGDDENIHKIDKFES